MVGREVACVVATITEEASHIQFGRKMWSDARYKSIVHETELKYVEILVLRFPFLLSEIRVNIHVVPLALLTCFPQTIMCPSNEIS